MRSRRFIAVAALAVVAAMVAGGALVLAKRDTSTTSGTTGGGDVYTHAEDPATCIAQASAFSDYPLVWAGPSVLGYPLVSCAHIGTKTRRAPDGRVSHPGGDSWMFIYGTCTIAEGRESCAPPISIRIDPCARMVDGGIIPWPGRPTRSMTVRGVEALIGENDIIFEQSPQQITIYASGSSSDTVEQVANAVKVAEALLPANALADGLSKGEPLSAAFLKNPDAFCASSSGASTTPVAELTATPAASAPPAMTDSVISTNKTACAQMPTTIAHRKTSVAGSFSAVATVVVRSTPVLNGDEPAVQTATANRIAQGIAGGLTQVARGATFVAGIDATAFAAC